MQACMRAQSMEVLSLQENDFMGELPMSWAAPGRFPALGYLDVWKNSLSGAVPATWGNWNAFPALKQLCDPSSICSLHMPDLLLYHSQAFCHIYLKIMLVSTTVLRYKERPKKCPAIWTATGQCPCMHAWWFADASIDACAGASSRATVICAGGCLIGWRTQPVSRAAIWAIALCCCRRRCRASCLPPLPLRQHH